MLVLKTIYSTALPLMELFNVLSATTGTDEKTTIEPAVVQEAVTHLLLLLSPMVPHFAAEMWEISGNAGSVEDPAWPKYDEEAAKKQKEKEKQLEKDRIEAIRFAQAIEAEKERTEKRKRRLEEAKLNKKNLFNVASCRRRENFICKWATNPIAPTFHV